MAHTCHATRCETPVPPSMWGCRTHWYMVPKPLRDRIWKHYRAGQEEDWQPSREYLEAAREAVIAVAQREGLEPDTRVYDAFLKALDGYAADYLEALSDQALEEWIEARPPAVREVCKRLPPRACLRRRDTKAHHYRILSYGEHPDGSVTLKLLHGSDSILPGLAVFGVDPAELEVCGCGSWESAGAGEAVG